MIDDVHRWAVHGRHHEARIGDVCRAVRSAISASKAGATTGLDGLLAEVAAGSDQRREAWETRLPETAYINTGREVPVTLAPPDSRATTSDIDGVIALLAASSDDYRVAIAEVDPSLDAPTHHLLMAAIEQIDDHLTALAAGRDLWF